MGYDLEPNRFSLRPCLKPHFFRGVYVEIHGVLLGGFSMSGSMRASAKSKMKKQSAWQRRRAMKNIRLVDGSKNERE